MGKLLLPYIKGDIGGAYQSGVPDDNCPLGNIYKISSHWLYIIMNMIKKQV